MKNLNTDFIPFARPSITAAEEEALLEVVHSGWLTTGTQTAEFEKEFAAACGGGEALAVNSATSGLHLALEASGVVRDDFVITTPYTFTSTAETIRYLGAHPLFADIEAGSFNISVENIERTISANKNKKISAVIPVDVGGVRADIKEVLDVARENNIRVVEDAAHLLPHDKTLPGSDYAMVYSFYATKCIAAGEGGMILTSDKTLAHRMKLMRFHGLDREAWNRYNSSARKAWEYDILAPGYKYNLSDMASALGRVQLKRAGELLAARKLISERYNQAFSEFDYFRLPPDGENNSWHLYILGLDTSKLTIDRDDFAAELSDSGIGISVHYKPLHLMTYYRTRYGFRPEDFPVSLEKFRSSFSLPIYPDLTEDQISRIIDTVTAIGKKHYRSV